MARALAAAVAASLLVMGSVAVSGVSATAAPVAPDQDPDQGQVQVQVREERGETQSVHEERREETYVERRRFRGAWWAHRERPRPV